MTRAQPALPPVTDEHRRAAFAAMGWPGWTYEAAMADPVRGRIVECRAHQLRTQQWKQERRAQHWRRTPWPPLRGASTDLKRAAAGDRDD